MSSGFDPDVDDFFAQMVAEESHKVAQVTRIVRSNRQRTRERLQHVTAATNASQHSPSSSPSSSSLPSSNNAALEDRNPYTLRTALGDLLKSAASANTRMQTRQDAMRTVRATVATLPRDLLRVVFVPSVYEPLIELFRDGFFREAAISVMLDMVETLKQDAQSCLGILLPVLKGRWQKRYNMFVEGSEEVRLLLLRLTTSLVRHCSTAIGEFPSYLDDLCDTILVNAYSDYHHVKEESCTCTVELCKNIRAIEFKSVSLLNSIVPNLSHQRHSVRIATIRAVEYLVMNGGVEQLKEIYPIWKSLAMDHVSAVRMAMLDTAYHWGTSLTDRLSFQQQIIVPILICISDPIAQLREKAHSMMLELGEQHMKHDVRDDKEEEDMKDIEMYSVEETEDVDNSDLLPHEFVSMTRRQTLGARLLVRANLRKILPEVLEGMFDVLNLNVRIRMTKLLQTLTIYSEYDMTQHVDKILSNFFRAFDDTEVSFRDEIHYAAQLLGRFVYPDAYLKYIFAHTKPEYAASPVMLTNVIRVLATVVHGARSQRLEPYFKERDVGGINIAIELSKPHLLFTDHMNLKHAMLSAIDALVENAGANIVHNDFAYFLLVLNICSQPISSRTGGFNHDDSLAVEIGNRGRDLMQKISQLSHLEGPDALYEKHFKAALDSILVDVARWDKTSPGLYTFEGLLVNGSQASVAYMDTLLPIFNRFLADVKKHADVALRVMNVVNNVLANAGKQMHPSHLTRFLKEIIIPGLVWCAGQVPALIRSQAIASLNCIVTQNMLQTEEQWDVLLDKNKFKHILECLDEDNSVTRLIAVRTVGLLAPLAKDRLSEEQWHDTQAELQKKMDDFDTQIRIETAKVLGNVLQSLPATFNIEEFRSLVRNLLVHLGDDAIDIRQQLYESLKTAINAASPDRKQIYSEEIAVSAEKHRDETFCMLLLKQELPDFIHDTTIKADPQTNE